MSVQLAYIASPVLGEKSHWGPDGEEQVSKKGRTKHQVRVGNELTGNTQERPGSFAAKEAEVSAPGPPELPVPGPGICWPPRGVTRACDLSIRS